MTLASILLAAFGFMVLIVLHEFGHFAAAKWVGMRVERFALFFPPLIWRKQVGETEYALGTIPAGGYVRISGMNPSEDLPEEVRDRAYHAQPPWKRMVVIAAGPLMNILIAFVLLFAYLAMIGPRDPTEASGTVDVIEKGYPGGAAARARRPARLGGRPDGRRRPSSPTRSRATSARRSRRSTAAARPRRRRS